MYQLIFYINKHKSYLSFKMHLTYVKGFQFIVFLLYNFHTVIVQVVNKDLIIFCLCHEFQKVPKKTKISFSISYIARWGGMIPYHLFKINWQEIKFLNLHRFHYCKCALVDTSPTPLFSYNFLSNP